MKLTPKKINLFTMMKLPSAWICGVRLKSISDDKATVSVTHRWINQNPFKSMYFAVQMMAAELSTGALVMKYIRNNNQPISMLVATNNARFSKKAKGKITFTCVDGVKIQHAIKECLETQQAKTCWMQSVGVNENNEVVSTINFEWTIKLKNVNKK